MVKMIKLIDLKTRHGARRAVAVVPGHPARGRLVDLSDPVRAWKECCAMGAADVIDERLVLGLQGRAQG